MDHPQPTNPFTHQGRITDPSQFFGRRAELEQLTNLLGTMQPVSVVGERRIGKSSLLYHIFQTGRDRLGGEVTVAYTDFPDVKDEAGFYECCCRSLHQADKSFEFDAAKPAPEYRLRNLETMVRDRRVVFCFDEFERVLRSSAFKREFFDTLRSFAQAENVTLLIATEHSLADLALDEHIATSPFFNIFRRIDLGLFAPDEADTFIRKRFDAANVEITNEEVDRLLRLAGRYPFYHQLGCYRLYEMKLARAAEWERAFKRDAEDHLRYLWNRLKPSERAAMRKVIDLSLVTPHERIVEDLERRGLLVQDGKVHSGWSCFGEVFDEFVINPRSRPVRDRLRRIRLPWLESVEITLWPPGVKVTSKRTGDKQK